MRRFVAKGDTFERLTVTKFVGIVGHKRAWECLCVCGRTTVVQTGSLTSGHIRSCGCLANKTPLTNRIGQKFGRLTVIGLGDMYVSPRGNRERLLKCLCVCGNTVQTRAREIMRPKGTRSCGCWKRDKLITHGEFVGLHGGTTPEYEAWRGIIHRCTNPRAKSYKDYGGRGIQVYPEWRNSYEAFLADVGRRPTRGHSIDRYPDNDGNYEPGNVRWATPKEQQQNTRKIKRAS